MCLSSQGIRTRKGEAVADYGKRVAEAVKGMGNVPLSERTPSWARYWFARSGLRVYAHRFLPVGFLQSPVSG